MASTDSKTFTGQCACGSTKYRIELPAEADVPKQSLCHCLYCKRMSGSCFSRSVLVPLPTIIFTSGEPKKFTRKRGNGGGWWFCSECGGQIYGEHESIQGLAAVRVGTLDRQNEFTEVGMHLNCENESVWLKKALEQQEGRFQTFPTGL